MEKCYEYFGCHKNTDCMVKKKSDESSNKPCWEINKVKEKCILHIGLELSDFDDTEKVCEFCLYYKQHTTNRFYD